MKKNQYKEKVERDYQVMSISIDKDLYKDLRKTLKNDKTTMPRHSVSSYIRFLIWYDLKTRKETDYQNAQLSKS